MRTISTHHRIKGIIFIAILFIGTSVFGQNVTINSTQLTTGLAGSPLIGGSSDLAVFGIQLDKSNGAANTVTSLVVTLDQDPTVRFSSAKLYSSTNNSFGGVGSETLVSTGVISTGPNKITFTASPITDFGGVTTAASSYLFMVVTVNSSVTNSTNAITPSLASADLTLGTAATISGSLTGSAYSFSTLAVTATANNAGAPSTIMAASTNQVLFGFSAKTNGTQSINNVVFTVTLPSSVPNLSGFLSNLKLKDDGSNTTYSGSGIDLGSITVSTGPASSYTLTLTPSVALSGTDKHFYLVTDVPGTTPTTTGISVALTTLGVTQGTTSSLTGFSRNFDITALTATLATNNSSAPSSILAGATNQVLFGFSAKTSGTQSINNVVFTLTLPSSIPNLSSLLTTIKLKDDGTNSSYSGSGTDLGSMSVSAGPSSTYTLTLTPSIALSGTDKYFYLVADVPGAASSTNGIQVALTTLGVTQGTTSSITSFSRTFDIGSLSATVTPIAAGTAPVPGSSVLSAGTTTQVLTGFSITSNGSQVLSSINFNISSAASLSNVSLYRSTSAGSVGSSITTNSTGNFDLTSVSAGNKTVNSTAVYYYLVADISNSVTSSTASITVTPNQSNIAVGSGSIGAFSISRTYTFNSSQLSDIDYNGNSTSLIAYKDYQTASGLTNGNSENLGDFRLRDGAGTSDPDNSGTTLTSLTISVSNFANVRTLALFDGGTNISEQPAAASVTFPSLSVSASDGNSKTLTLRATFNSSVTDNQFIQITVTNAISSTSGSGFTAAAAGGATTGGATNKINVVATKLIFVSNPPNTAINTNFSLTVKAVDHPLNNLDTDVNSQVTLSKSGGNASAVLSASPQILNPNLSSGQFAWTSLKLNFSGTYTLTGAHATLTDASGSVIITSNGVLVSVSPNTPISMCYNSSFQTLNDITIQEVDPADFSSGAGQIFSLVLPAGFIFDIANSAPTPSVTVTGSNISSPIQPTYVGNNIVKIGYSISGTNALDQITIKNLKVKYINTTPVTAADAAYILRYGGTAVQAGNSDADAKSHGQLIADAGTAPVGFGFTVQSLPGNLAVNPSQTNFNASDPDVQLIGSPSGGTFSGNGVVYSSTLPGYKFSPTAAGPGTYTISYTYKDLTGQQCTFTSSKSFTVSTSLINGLVLQYCSDAAPATGLNVTQTNVDNYFGPGYTFISFIYYDPNELGGYPSYYKDIPGTNTTFDPQASYFLPIYNVYASFLGRGVYLGYKVKRTSDGTFNYAFQFVRVPLAPTVTFTIPKNQFCYDEAQVLLTGSPTYTSNNSEDFFTSSIGAGAGVLYDAGQWVFRPSTTGASSNPVSLNVTYTYKDKGTGCSVTSAPQAITVNPRPGIVQSAEITSGTALHVCENPNGSAVNFTTSSPTTLYKWYGTSNLSDTPKSGPSFTPSSTQFNTSSANTTNFYVTKTVSGCESLTPLTLSAIADPKPLVNAGSDLIICQGSDASFSLMASPPSVSGAGAGGATWSTTSTGEFKNSSDAVDNTFGSTIKYIPSISDIQNKTVILTLTASSPNSCPSTTDNVEIKINQVAVPNAGLDATVCSGQAIVLNGNITGGTTTGTWTRNGQGTFGSAGDLTTTDPLTYYNAASSELALGATITFTLTTDDPDAGGPCTPLSDAVIVTINQRALVDAGPDQAICDGEVINLAGIIPTSPPSSAGSFTWSGGSNIFTDPVSGTPNTHLGDAVYTPQLSEVGTTVVLTLTSNDPDGTGPNGPCSAETDQVSITIKPIPSAPTAISPAPYCVGNAIAPLTAAPANASATLNWYKIENNYIPANSLSTQASFPTGEASNTDKKVKYFVTQTILGCQSPATTVEIVVNPLPSPLFTVAHLCLGDNTEFKDVSTLSYNNGNTGSITSWQWDFDDGYILTSGAGTVDPTTHNGATGGFYNLPTHKYSSTKDYNVRLTVTSSDNCTNSTTSQGLGSLTRIGPVPIANFSIENICDQDNTQFKYTGSGPGGSVPLVIASYSWTFGDPSSSVNTASSQNPTHKFTGVDTYSVSVTATSDLGCSDTKTKPTFILPYIKTFPYQESFESTTHGWVTEGLNTNEFSSWHIATPAGTIINAAQDGNKAWITNNGLNTYSDNERSVVYGPCFDITQLQRPVLNMQYWNNSDPGNDGAYMEYSIDNGATWKPLGEIGKGLEWYNRSAILGLSQQNGVGQAVGQIGWSGVTSNWVAGKYNLDDWKTQTKFRVRLFFGSNGDNPTGVDGFALDNFKIETRNRIILTENFTSNSATGATANNNNFDNFFLTKPTELVKLQYHVGIPEADVINKQNPADLNARAAFYGLTNSSSLVPRVFLDGTSNDPGNFVSSTTWADSYYQSRSLVTSPFDIVISTLPTDNDKLSVNVNLKATSAITQGKHSLFIAIIEKKVGNEEFIVRKLLPSPTGTPLTLPIALNQVITVNPAPWEVKNINSLSELAIVAFVQDVETREILQAAYLANPGNLPSVTTGIEQSIVTEVNSYPNPADHELTIQLPNALKQNISIQLSDQLGKIVYRSSLHAGDQNKTISTQELSEGLYILQIEADGKVVRTKIIVTHKQ